MQENAEAETASQQETQTETTATGKVEITTEDFEGSSDPENAEREYTYTYQVPTITIEGNEEAQNKIQKDLNAYVETFLDSINNSDFGTVYEGEMAGVTSYEELCWAPLTSFPVHSGYNFCIVWLPGSDCPFSFYPY